MRVRLLAAQTRPSFEATALESRKGRRECRVKASPMARQQQKKLAAVTTGSAKSSGIPCAMVLTVSFALSLGTGLSCPHRLADRIRAT
jgi:hypothetical protein